MPLRYPRVLHDLTLCPCYHPLPLPRLPISSTTMSRTALPPSLRSLPQPLSLPLNMNISTAIASSSRPTSSRAFTTSTLTYSIRSTRSSIQSLRLPYLAAQSRYHLRSDNSPYSSGPGGGGGALHAGNGRFGVTMRQVRGFRSSVRREMPGSAVVLGAFGVMKSSAALACIVAVSRLFLSILPFAAVKTIKIKMKRKFHARTHETKAIPKHVSAFYEAEVSVHDEPIRLDCGTVRRLIKEEQVRMAREEAEDSGGVVEACGVGIGGRGLGKEEDEKSLTRRVMSFRTTEGRGAEEVIHGCRPPFTRDELRCCRTHEEKQRMATKLYTWTLNISRANTGLPPLEREEFIAFNPWNRWKIFINPPLPPEVLEKIEGMSRADKEKLYDLRRWHGLEKIMMRGLKKGVHLIWFLVWAPIIMFAVVSLFSLEQVPFTGRWRMIMLSPEEEDTILDKLRGPGWYKTVLSMFTTADAPAPPVVPMADWRWHWANSVMRRLEKGVEEHCRAVREGREMVLAGYEGAERADFDSWTTPPPPDYPLHPRARTAALLHGAVEGRPDSGSAHLQVGPPYALLLLDNEERNAMSYGFGEGGSGGVVIYTGILDEILQQYPVPQPVQPVQQQSQGGSFRFFASLFGLTSSTPPPPKVAVQTGPTEEQTLQLALVLAHELSHLLLSHHLESISWSEIVVPSAAGIVGDLVRTVLYPVTFFLGPFVNDAISDITKKKAEETTAYSDVHFSVKQEREADVVSLRLLAYAGFDPQAAVKYWSDVPQPACAKDGISAVEHLPFQFLRGTVHDEREIRFQRLLTELDRWKAYAKAKPKTQPTQ